MAVKVMSVVNVAARLLQAIAAVVVGGTMAYVAWWYNMTDDVASPSAVNFFLFVSPWTILALVYLELVSRLAPAASHPFAATALEGLTAVFHFAGFIPLAIFVSRLRFCRGMVCTSAQAGTVFAAAGFVLWAYTCVNTCLTVFKGGFRNRTTVGAQQMRQAR